MTAYTQPMVGVALCHRGDHKGAPKTEANLGNGRWVCLHRQPCTIIFLVDTGAAMFVINCKAMTKPPMSSETVKTASGLPFREHVTMPLPVSFCEKCQHQFLYSNYCPVNLMGRDLLCKLAST